MKRNLIVIYLTTALLSSGLPHLTGCSPDSQVEEAAPVVLNTFEEKVSYALGQDHATNLQRMGAEVDPDLLARGLLDALKGEEPALPPEEARRILAEFRQQMMSQTKVDRAEQAAKNQEEGRKFLAENRTRPDVQVTDSGLQYKVLAEGDGPTPTASNRVSVHYRGTLLDGTVFDSSHRRGQSAIFVVSNLIAGWSEALQLMKVGSKWELYIPPELAYGERGSGPMIGPQATLIFEVELLDIID